MRNKNTHLRYFLLLVFCLNQILVVAQIGDTVFVKISDSAKKEVQLLYSKVPAKLTAASTDVVYNKDIIKSPVTSVLNALTGRLSGVYFEQFSGEPSADGASALLHGRAPIILIDGVVRNLPILDLEEIESVTVLKDALSTAMLGVRGANGAILITTRKGEPGKQTVSFTAQSGIQQPLNLPKMLRAFDYAALRNEAIDNDVRVRPELLQSLNGLRYSAADLQAFKDGTDPYGHPDVDWQSKILQKSSSFNRYSLNASGGNNFGRFFVALEHFNQEGLFKDDPANKYSTNSRLKGYLARINIDINITPKLTGGISLLGRILNSNDPAGLIAGVGGYGGSTSIFSALLTTPNSAYPVYNADGTYGASLNYTMPNFLTAGQTQAANLQGLTTGSGYLQGFRRDIFADFNLKRTLDELLPGLWIKARVSYSSTLDEFTFRAKGYIAYRMNGQVLTPVGLKLDQENRTVNGNQGRSNYIEVSTGYSKVFNEVHGIDILLLANRDNMVAGINLPYTITGTSGRISYNYQQKYVLEAAYGYNGSNYYPGGKTNYGFFPSVGAAWNISNEDFAKNISWLSNLKLFASYGKTGWDNPGYFTYIQRYPSYTQPVFGTSATAQASVIQGTLANPGITWEKANKTNIGLQGALFNGHLGFSVEYYHNKMYDLLIQRGRNTSLLGVAYPNENIGINRYSGLDFQLSWQQKLNKLSYFIAGNASVQYSEVVYMDEVNYPYGYMSRTGRMVGRPYGFIADGIFQSAAEIANSATFKNNIPTQPGDIKYRDLNNDGEINQLDITAIGTNRPLTVYGINLGFNIGSFDFSALVQGVLNRNVFMVGNRFFEFQNGGLGQAYQQHIDRWTPSNTDGSYPRLSIGNNSNNKEFSSFWVRTGEYARLKNVEIGYSLPSNLMKRAGLSSVRIFANGLNLLTSTKEDIDPEVYFGSYPLQRVFNFGINIKL
jgi:TonB-linked SusC/RagA family outer membrane protein